MTSKNGADFVHFVMPALAPASQNGQSRAKEPLKIPRVEFDYKAFESLALNYEARMFQMAKSLDVRLYRSLAMAAIYRVKSNALQKK
jgi:hypothetical protein